MKKGRGRIAVKNKRFSFRPNRFLCHSSIIDSFLFFGSPLLTLVNRVFLVCSQNDFFLFYSRSSANGIILYFLLSLLSIVYNQLVEKKKAKTIPMLVRATTTTNAQGRRQRLVVPSAYKSNEIDVDYLQALKVFIYFSLDYFKSLVVEFRLSTVVNNRFISLHS